MIILNLSEFYQNQTSPITLRFKFDGVTLRFDKPWPNVKSPVYIRFNGDITPPLPIDNSIGIECGISWSQAKEIEHQLVLTEHAAKIAIAVDFVWSTPDVIEQSSQLHWMSFNGLEVNYNPFWALKSKVSNNITVKWSQPYIHQMNTSVVWQTPNDHQLNHIIPWLNVPALQLLSSIVWKDGHQHNIEHVFRYSGLVCDAQYQTGWGPHAPRWICSTDYRPPQAGLITIRFNESLTQKNSPIAIRFTPSSEYCYWDDGGGVIDGPPILPPFDFRIPIEPQIRRSYLMQPQISCIRVSDGAVVVLKSVSISQSRSQFASSGSLVFSSRIDAQRAANELLKISINGYDFYLLCESPSEAKVFGKSSYSASVRSRLATLASPNKKATNYVNVVARSFMGLMADIVANTGWTVASEIVDYQVPANAFSYAAKTPAEAINSMATSIGAMLDVNDEAQTITVIPQWPVVPWDTASAVADVILHDGVIIEFNESVDIRPDADAVFVRGEQQGVAAKVKRFGTAGDSFAADIVDKLITDNQAARMRATTELANAGNKVQTTIRTKVMADLPPIRPGMLIGVRKGVEVFKSVCEGFSISGSVNESTGKVTVNQTVTLLRNQTVSEVAA
jgi:hypothetical protein